MTTLRVAIAAFLAMSLPGAMPALAAHGAAGALNLTVGVTTLLPPADGTFHYTTITVGPVATLRFVSRACAAGSPSNAGLACTAETSCGGTNGVTGFCSARLPTPIVLTATGDVTIQGAIDVSAGFGSPRRAGPAGHDGGLHGTGAANGGSSGDGLSPGVGGLTGLSAGGGGGYGTAGASAIRHSAATPAPGGTAVALDPTKGGSGGGGGGGSNISTAQHPGGDGGGGGGVLRIETPADITVSGRLSSNGAAGGISIFSSGPGGGGSGGVLDLAASIIALESSALVEAKGGKGGGKSTLVITNPEFSSEADGGLGYVRLTATTRLVRRVADINAVVIVNAPYVVGRLDHFYCYKTKATRGELCAANAPLNPGAACLAEEDCGGVSSGPGETSLCAPNGFPGDVRVTLEDQLEPELVWNVTNPVGLCNPADKNGEGILDADSHLARYAIALTKGRCAAGSPANALAGCTGEADCGGTKGVTAFCVPQSKPTPHENLRVRNQFHHAGDELMVDAVKPDRLLVPTAKNLTGPPAPLGSTEVDHYACYTVRLSAGAPKWTPILGVRVDDQLTAGQRVVDLKKPSRLCVPANKNGEGMQDPDAHLMCYQAVPVSKLCAAGARLNPGLACKAEADCGGTRSVTTLCLAQGKHQPVVGIFLTNQFGPEQMDTVREEELCVPSEKFLPLPD